MWLLAESQGHVRFGGLTTCMPPSPNTYFTSVWNSYYYFIILFMFMEQVKQNRKHNVVTDA